MKKKRASPDCLRPGCPARSMFARRVYVCALDTLERFGDIQKGSLSTYLQTCCVKVCVALVLCPQVSVRSLSRVQMRRFLTHSLK